MANVGKTGVLKFTDTFAINSLGTGVQGLAVGTQSGTTLYGIAWQQNIGTSDTPLAISVSATKGLHLAGSLAATDNNRIEMMSPNLMFYGQQGFCAADVMLQVDTASSCEICFGLTGENTGSAMRMPVELNTATWASTGSNFIGLVKDFDATNDEFHCFWVDDDTDTTETVANLRMRGASFVKDKWCYLRVELQDCGSGNPVRATFHVEQDGKTFEKEFNTSFDRDQAMAWYLGVANKAGIARGVYVKAPGWEYSISD